MGRSYFVPRSVKGETRILVIFSVKSFISTLIFGLIGGGVWYLCSALFNIGLVPGLIMTAVFAAIGYAIGALKIPDLPTMGKFRKAGGENLSDIIIRYFAFKRKKKIYLYNVNRGFESNKGGN